MGWEGDIHGMRMRRGAGTYDAAYTRQKGLLYQHSGVPALGL